ATITIAFAQLATGDSSTFRGKVTDDFGTKIVIETDAGKFLVEPRGATPGSYKVTQGEDVIVTGIAQQRIIDASRILRETGETVFFAASTALPSSGPAPISTAVAGWVSPDVTGTQTQAVLKANGLVQVGGAERKKRHIEIPARDADGRDVIASIDLYGRIWEIEDADHDKKRVPIQVTSETQAAEIIRRAGYGTAKSIERRKHHFEVLATSSSGEPLELHLDMAGRIYKRLWIR
ncbi:MAG: hypothetical protein ACRCTX_19380, partial [Afipia sp.]